MTASARSIALETWLVDRRADLAVIESAHRAIAQTTPGAGRPRRHGGDHLAQAFIIRLYAEFQGFVRDLHDAAVAALGEAIGLAEAGQYHLVLAATTGRGIDRGNAGMQTIRTDFFRLGLDHLTADISRLNPTHARDQRVYDDLTALRNAIAHANSSQLATLHRRGVRATLTYGRRVIPSLNRIARALDAAVWGHLTEQFDIDGLDHT